MAISETSQYEINADRAMTSAGALGDE